MFFCVIRNLELSPKVKFSNIFRSCRLVFFDKSQEKVNHIILITSSGQGLTLQ